MNRPQHVFRLSCRVWYLYLVSLILAPLFLSSAALAGDPLPDSAADASDDEIQIVADRLITNDAEKFAEFSGDVRASQGSFVITSERLRIYYPSEALDTKDQSADRQSIKRITASGNVQITTDRFTAKADRAEYDMQTQVVVLMGENATLSSENNILTGSTITLDRKTGQMKVESPPQKRVKAVFYPKHNGENKK
ncbi:MAG: lipopolysaccharide transport periplasmic protein LptA [Desulfobacterales bacterium]|nr:lipopolysaccharide transport periplasmic protein LptA [Desulfobacterales bacterium]